MVERFVTTVASPFTSLPDESVEADGQRALIPYPGHIMRSRIALLTAFLFVACSTAPATRDRSDPQNASMNPAVEFLLTSAATDFHTHRPPNPVGFRVVRSGYVMTPEGTRQYRLCCEFAISQR